MGIFSKKPVVTPVVPAAPKPAPEMALEVESNSEPVEEYKDEPQYVESAQSEQADEDDEVAKLEKAVQEAKARKKAKEEAELAQEQAPEAQEGTLADVLRAFDNRLTVVEADLYRLTRR